MPSLRSGTTAQVTKCSSSLGLSVYNKGYNYYGGALFTGSVMRFLSDNYTGIIIEDIISLTNLCYKDNNNNIEDIYFTDEFVLKRKLAC